MPGNELEIVKFLLSRKGKIVLPHVGKVDKISTPIKNNLISEIIYPEDISLVTSDNSSKKADILLNDIGISLKQTGVSFAFNRIQRESVVSLFKLLKIKSPRKILDKLDLEVDNFHNGINSSRSRPWRNIFTLQDFTIILQYLMMKGSPNLRESSFPAQYIIEGKPKLNVNSDLKLFTFEEYLETYQDNLFVAIRRCWYGQSSKSEHNRAMSLMKKSGNTKWIYDNVSGTPKGEWRDNIAESDRKTVYYISIEKK